MGPRPPLEESEVTRLIAEGVEDEEALRILADLSVDQAQGYLFGRPGPLKGAG